MPAIERLGVAIPELRVSASQPFMSTDEIAVCVAAPSSVFLVATSEGARDGALAGFCYASIGDLDRAAAGGQACIVYLAVAAEHRGAGIGAALYAACVERLTARGVHYVYAWADPGPVVMFLQRRGFAVGKSCVWMDRSLVTDKEKP